jgi:hypothetical protein
MASALAGVSRPEHGTTRMYRLRLIGFVGLALSAAGVLASFGGCSSGDGATAGECNSNPFECAAGTTCSVSSCSCTCTTPDCCTHSNCTPVFACLPSNPEGLEGSSCSTDVGKASCNDGLTCVVQMGQGVCTPYCSSSQACAQGLECVELTVELGPPAMDPVIHVCETSASEGGGIIVVDSGTGPTPIVEGGSPEGSSSEGGEGGSEGGGHSGIDSSIM